MTESKRSRPFLQFPLCLLAYGENHTDRLNAIISYALVENAPGICGGMSEELYMNYLSRAEPPQDYERYMDSDNYEIAERLLVAATRLGISLGRVDHNLKKHATVSKYVAAFESRHGKDVSVRMETDMLFEVRDGGGMSYNEFAVLCAIYSRIGASKKPVRITRDDIRRRSAGYRKEAVYGRESADLRTRRTTVSVSYPSGWKTAARKRGLYTYAGAVTYRDYYCPKAPLLLSEDGGLFEAVPIGAGAGCVYRLRPGAPADERKGAHLQARFDNAFKAGDSVVVMDRSSDRGRPLKATVVDVMPRSVTVNVDGQTYKLSNGSYLVTPWGHCRNEAPADTRDDVSIPLLSTREVRTLIDKLHARGFFARYTYMRRQMYFSHRMSDEELREAVVNSKLYRARHEAKQRQKDRETDELIREMRRKLKAI